MAVQSILDLSLPELEEFMRSLGQPAYRARQVFEWVYRRHVPDFAAMSNLPLALRDKLSSESTLTPVAPVSEQRSADGTTTKVLLRLPDGEAVEAVLMRYGEDEDADTRRSVCVSSQVGCPVGCGFCATGQSGFVRNLTTGEIVAQVLYFARALAMEGYERPVTNVVFMGQGEPFLNLENVRRAIEILNSPHGMHLGARHITISTSGVIPGIKAIATWPLQVGLAVSLHAPDDALRNDLVPLNRRYPLAKLLAACLSYEEMTGRRVTFEYALIDGINDEPRQARRLAELLAGHLSHVNLIPLNATPESGLRASPPNRVFRFQEELTRRGIPCTVRIERGADIAAACGQLRRRVLREEAKGSEA